MKLELLIPTTLSDIPLGHYQKFMEVADGNSDSEFIAEKMIQIFCGIELKDVVKIKSKDVFEMVDHFNKVFTTEPKFKPTFKINDTEFGFIPNLEDISFGEYIDLENNLFDIKTIHKAMAVLYRPIISKHRNKYLIEEYVSTVNYAEVMKFAPLDVVLAAKVFFYNLKNELLTALSLYLEKQTQDLMNIAKESNLEKNGDGIRQFIDSQKEILQGLTMSHEWDYSSALPSLHLKHS